METLSFDQQPILITTWKESLNKSISLKRKGLLKEPLKRPQKKTGFQVGLEDLQQVANLKAAEAAKSPKVCTSALKRICREFNIERWPPWGVILHELTSSAPSSQRSHQISDVTTVGDTMIKFQLSLSSGVVDLQQQVTKKLKLEPEDYYIKYKDKDDELILLVCDEDLLDCVSTSK